MSTPSMLHNQFSWLPVPVPTACAFIGVHASGMISDEGFEGGMSVQIEQRPVVQAGPPYGVVGDVEAERSDQVQR